MKLIACFLLFAAVAVSAQGQEMTKTFSGIKKINLATSSGGCKLVKGATNDVTVKVSYTYSSSDYQPIMEQEGGTLVLKEDFQNKRSYSGESSWVIILPENLDLKFSSGSGNFEVSDMSVKISANTGSGDYHWKNVKGDSKINTGSGDIVINDFQGDISLNTGSGNIEISKAEGDLKANTGSGDIRLAGLKGAFSMNVGSGNIIAKDLTLTGKGSFNSGSGDATVELASSPDYNISVNSGSGDATLNFKGNKMEGKVIMTASKKHGEIVAPFSFDKTEEINDDGDNTRIRKTAQLGSKGIEIKVSTGSGRAEIRK